MEKKKREDLEMKVYEKLGVKGFKKLAFKLEKIVHRKDKGFNQNYHTADGKCDLAGIKEFKKYYYYNGFIHVKNLAFGAIAMTTMALLHAPAIPMITLGIFLLKDAYCVMLQRYNWIRMSRTEEKLKIRERKRIEKLKEKLDKEKIEKVLEKNKVNREELLRDLKNIRDFIKKSGNGIMEVGSTLGTIQEILPTNNTKEEVNTEKEDSVMKLTL